MQHQLAAWQAVFTTESEWDRKSWTNEVQMASSALTLKEKGQLEMLKRERSSMLTQ